MIYLCYMWRICTADVPGTKYVSQPHRPGSDTVPSPQVPKRDIAQLTNRSDFSFEEQISCANDGIGWKAEPCCEADIWAVWVQNGGTVFLHVIHECLLSSQPWGPSCEADCSPARGTNQGRVPGIDKTTTRHWMEITALVHVYVLLSTIDAPICPVHHHR